MNTTVPEQAENYNGRGMGKGLGYTITPFKETTPSRGSHVFQQTITIKKLGLDIIKANVVTKFHKDLTTNMNSRVLTRKTAPPLANKIVLTRKTAQLSGGHFHVDWNINVTSRVLTRKTATPPDGHTINLTTFHEDWTLNVTRKTAPPPGIHVFQWTGTIFDLNCDIIGTNILTMFHEDWTINVTPRVLTRKTALPPDGHVFKRTGTIFELSRAIIRTNVLTNLHEDWTINVTSRVLTKFYYSHIMKTAPPPGGHVFQPSKTIFELT
ncbi:hypothetical protein DPMN_004266 [Dreissena polymorpha]|uniref:Uncharacterized protein n=1 Tax=Dreissena polymorpha TaxID=45954 RepID=A0A9D4RVR9_DREPO|nr:hypothetical protein DPMN_004266 [Dreissena polymorpha]